MASINQSYVQLARTLHPRLLKFFSRHPPELSSAPKVAVALNTSSQDANKPHVESASTTPPNTESTTLIPCQNNPFLARKAAVSGGWLPPKYSLRHQADLYKLAVRHGVDSLLPYTKKSLAERTRKREERGLRVKGTGVGQRVKGHVLERYLHEKLEKRKTAMRRMGGLIRFWRLRKRSKGWKAWPKMGR